MKRKLLYVVPRFIFFTGLMIASCYLAGYLANLINGKGFTPHSFSSKQELMIIWFSMAVGGWIVWSTLNEKKSPE